MSASAGLRARLVVGLVATVALAILVATGATAWSARSRVRAADDALARGAIEHARTILELETFRYRERGEIVRARVVAGGPNEPISADARLDVFEGFGPDGAVIASLAWPESRGTRREPPGIGVAGEGAVWSVPTAAGPRAAWVVRLDPLVDEPAGTVWVSGRWIESGPNSADALGAHGAALESWPVPDPRDRSRVATAAGEARTWGVVVPSSGAATGVDGLMLAALLAGVVCVLSASIVGWWIIRAATRPLDAVAGAFEAVAEGRADYDFPLPGDAVFGDVVGSYSRVRRALDAERDRVRAAERVAAWTETARRVAHEVKNPLAPIRLTVENLVKARERAPERFDAMFATGTRAILEEVERLRRVVSEFSEYARLPEPRPRPADLDAVVDSVIALHAGNERVTLRRERSGPIPEVAVDRDLIGQAIRNLVDNAIREALESGGEVVVRSGVDAGSAFVEVRDHGAGLDDEALARALEPDFSARRGGSGLGLAIAQRIAVEHGGLISIANAPDGAGGAVATLRLPIARGDLG